MPMRLEGSCRCGAVRFSAESSAPCPYQLCYCAACRKSGGAGYAINLLADAGTLSVTGTAHVKVYRAIIHSDPYNGAEGPCRRHFCERCGSMLWIHDPDWPDLLHPFASAIDTPLPTPPSRTHIMLDFKAPWVEPDIGEGDATYDRYPELSIEEWHKGKGVWLI